jgi:CHAT domain-containing protein
VRLFWWGSDIMRLIALIVLLVFYSRLGLTQINQNLEETLPKFVFAVEQGDHEKVIKIGGILLNEFDRSIIPDSVYNNIIENTLISNWQRGEIEKVNELSIIYIEHSTKQFGASSLEVGKGWYYKGISLAILNDYDGAVYSLKRAIYVYTNLKSNDTKYVLDFILQTKYSLGNVLEKQQKYKEALSLFVDLQSYYEQENSDSLQMVNIYNYIVKINNELGNYNIALKYAQLSLKYSIQLFSQDSAELIKAYNNLAQVHLSLGDYSEALNENNITLELIENNAGIESIWYATSLANIATLFSLMGQDNEAYKLDSISSSIILRIAPVHSYEYIKSCLKMGSKLPLDGNIDVPIYYLSLGLRSVRKTFDKGCQFEVEFLQELSFWQNLKNNSSSVALRNAELATKFSKKLFEKDPINGLLYHQSLSNYGQLLIDNGKSRNGLEIKFKALKYFANELGINSQTYLNEFDYIKFVAMEMGDHEFLKKYWGKVLETKFLNYYENSIGLSEKEKLNYKLTINRDLDNYLSYVFQFKNDSIFQYAYELYINMNGFVRSDKKHIIESAQSSNDQMIKLYYDQWVLYNSELNSINEGGKSKLDYEKPELLDLIANAEREISRSYSSVIDSKSFITKSKIENKLKKHEIFIEIIPIKSAKYIISFIDNNSGNSDYIVIDNEEDFENEVINNHLSIRSRKKEAIEFKDVLSYEHFWKPIASKIGDARVVYFSSGGAYNKINLNTIYNPESGKYLIEEYDIRIVNSARDFVLNMENVEKKYTSNSASLFGFPDFDGNTTASGDTSDLITSTRDLNSFWLDSLTRGGMNAKPLPATKIEVENISSTLKSKGWQVNSFLADNASETNIKKQQSPRILHVATHGYFFKDIPVEKGNNRFLGMDRQQVIQDPMLRSGLLLMGANKTLKGETSKGENGLLSAAEASLLDLRETELVVLSACETGRGEESNSEGVYGLRKAFSDAGAQNIIMSLWKVDDKVTQEFMSRFYEIWLNDKTTIRQAFNKTQLEIKAKYPEPYYWGAFILVGE